MRNTNDTIDNPTRDLPNFTAVPQTTATPHTLYLRSSNYKYFSHALYMVTNQMSKKMKVCGTKRVTLKRPKFEIMEFYTLDKFVK